MWGQRSGFWLFFSLSRRVVEKCVGGCCFFCYVNLLMKGSFIVGEQERIKRDQNFWPVSWYTAGWSRSYEVYLSRFYWRSIPFYQPNNHENFTKNAYVSSTTVTKHNNHTYILTSMTFENTFLAIKSSVLASQQCQILHLNFTENYHLSFFFSSLNLLTVKAVTKVFSRHILSDTSYTYEWES